MRFLSVCSGIEAASVAWIPLGWQAVAYSEIEPFPCAVLAHHYPSVPNWGDMTKYKEWPDVSIDLLCGGTPCQSFSVAGLRKGLDDPRGNLMLTFGAIAGRYRPRWLVWENVPGVLSSNGGRDFGAFLGMLGQLGYGFAYRVLDAQYFGVAQRRRRVFVVGYLGDWRRAAAVLFERHSLQGNPAPGREARKNVAGTLAGGARERGGSSQDDISSIGIDYTNGLIQGEISGTIDAGQDRGNRGQGVLQAFGGNNQSGSIEVAAALNASASASASGRMDFESESFIVSNPLLGKSNCSHDATKETYVTHSLRGEGFDASEDGTGRGTPLVPVAFDTTQQNGFGIGVEVAGTQRAMAHSDSHSNGGGHQAVAYAIQAGALRTNPNSGPDGVGVQADNAYTLEARAEVQAVATLAIRGRDGQPDLEVRHDGTANALLTPNGGRAGIGVGAVHYGMQVRRLTPEECEALQAFPCDYTRIPWRGKSARQCPDGPRYKALGNSWCVNVARWVGQRIEQIESLEVS